MNIMTASPSASARKNTSSAAPKERQATTPPTGTNGEVTADRIRARAYEIYQARNGSGGPGDEVSDWAQAERELNGSAPEPSLVRDIEIKAQDRGERLLASGK